MDKSSIKNSSPEALEAYASKLDKFIGSVAEYMVQIKKTHENMNEFWKGDQYENFSDYIASVTDSVRKQLIELDQTKKFVKDKAQKLREARSVKIIR